MNFYSPQNKSILYMHLLIAQSIRQSHMRDTLRAYRFQHIKRLPGLAISYLTEDSRRLYTFTNFKNSIYLLQMYGICWNFYRVLFYKRRTSSVTLDDFQPALAPYHMNSNVPKVVLGISRNTRDNYLLEVKSNSRQTTCVLSKYVIKCKIKMI